MGSSLVPHSEILKIIADNIQAVRIFRQLLAANNRLALVIVAALEPLARRQREEERVQNYPPEKDPFDPRFKE